MGEQYIIEEHIASCDDIRKLKVDMQLELLWDCEEDDILAVYTINNDVCAAIHISPDPLDKQVVWIDEFEVLRKFRKQGVGYQIIEQVLKEFDNPVKLLAKNKQIQEFWTKCGFEDDGVTWAEIPLIYNRNKKVKYSI